MNKYTLREPPYEGAEFYEDGKWMRPDEVLDRLNQLEALRQSYDEVTLRVACARLGKSADWQETTRDNILYRIDELRWAESDRAILRDEIKRRDRYRMSCACSTGDCPHDNQQECIEGQAKTIEEQAAYIAKLEETVDLINQLPKTADGKPYSIGQELWHPKYGNPGKLAAWGFGYIAVRFYYPDTKMPMVNDWADIGPSECYSTREAAEKAKEQGND